MKIKNYVIAILATAVIGLWLYAAAITPRHEPEPTPPVVSVDIAALQADIDSLRKALDTRQEVLVKISFKGDTIWGSGIGNTGETAWGQYIHYRDSLVDITVYPEDTTVEYVLFPHEYGMLMGATGPVVWAKAWDITLGDTLAVDSIKVSREKPKLWRFGIRGGIDYSYDGRFAPEFGMDVHYGTWGIYSTLGVNRVSAGITKEF